MTAKDIEKILQQTLLHDAAMAYGLYEYELQELLDELQSSLAADRDDYIFAVTENSGHVAMVLIEKSGHVYINEQAREKLQVLSQIVLRRSCRGSCPCLWRGLGGQGGEQFGRSEAFVSLLDYQLPFLDHVHECDADERSLRRVKRFEP